MPISTRVPLVVLLLAAVAPAQERPGARPELNESFRDPDVGSYVERFESESREIFAHRIDILRAMALEPGMDVADIGAGTGLFTIPMAEAVGSEGAVYAVDIAPNFLQYIAGRADDAELTNVCTVLGTQNSTQLPPASVDLAFICDAYHHFEDPSASLASIHRAIRPGGRLFIVEFDKTDESRGFVKEHIRASRDVFVAEIKEAGFEAVSVEPAPGLGGKLKENFVAVFRRTDGAVGR